MRSSERAGVASLACFVLGVAAGCSATPSAAATVLALVDADNRGDLEGATGAYADDVVWLPPNGDRVAGIAAIRERYRDMFARFRVELEVDVGEEVVDGAKAVVRGTTQGRLHPRTGGAPTIVDDEFTAELRWHDGRWRIAQLAWQPRPATGATKPRR